SSRRRHTISKRDWSSDVCSSDLPALLQRGLGVDETIDEIIVVRTPPHEDHVVDIILFGVSDLVTDDGLDRLTECLVDIVVIADLLHIVALAETEVVAQLVRQGRRGGCPFRSGVAHACIVPSTALKVQTSACLSNASAVK